VAQRLADLGVAGINLEDGPDAPALLVEKIETIRSALHRSGGELFINARTDVILAGLATPERQVEETIARGQRYAAAGADGLFVPGLRQEGDIKAVAGAVLLPLNVMAWGGLPDAAALGRLGVHRLSSGSAIPQAALGAAEGLVRGFLDSGASEPLFAGSKAFGEVQKLFADA
jgi:2-methylisocitrate lyase-like PEP mutase family enzyme